MLKTVSSFSRIGEENGRAVCGALHGNSPDSLMRLIVNEEEFRIILWPEFPQSRPATGLPRPWWA